jgi:hypothetical protein
MDLSRRENCSQMISLSEDVSNQTCPCHHFSYDVIIVSHYAKIKHDLFTAIHARHFNRHGQIFNTFHNACRF